VVAAVAGSAASTRRGQDPVAWPDLGLCEPRAKYHRLSELRLVASDGSELPTP
jgi:hypothetical protein